MIAMRVISLMPLFGCFIACLGTASNAQNERISALTHRRLINLFFLWDVNGNGIVEMEEHSVITDCIGEEFNMDRRNKKRVYEGFTKAWKSFGFDKMEKGNAFHKSTMLKKFGKEKHSQHFLDGARRAYANLYDSLSCYTNSGTITFDQFRVFHYCLGVDLRLTPLAFEKIDVNRDRGISEDELCDAGLDFMISEDENGVGSLFFGEIQ